MTVVLLFGVLSSFPLAHKISIYLCDKDSHTDCKFLDIIISKYYKFHYIKLIHITLILLYNLNIFIIYIIKIDVTWVIVIAQFFNGIFFIVSHVFDLNTNFTFLSFYLSQK